MITIPKIDIIERKLEIEEEIEELLKQVRKLRSEHGTIVQIITNKISPEVEEDYENEQDFESSNE